MEEPAYAWVSEHSLENKRGKCGLRPDCEVGRSWRHRLEPSDRHIADLLRTIPRAKSRSELGARVSPNEMKFMLWCGGG